MPLFRIRNQFNSSALRAIESASRRPTLCFAVRDDDNNSGGGMTVHSSNLPAEVGKPKDLPARSAADVIAEMAAKVARYPAKPKEEWEEMSAEEMYQRGLRYVNNGYPINRVEAVKWYRRAAERGHAEAQAEIGHAYFLGGGVDGESNLAEAIKWFRLAAEQGGRKGQFNLGIFYFNGCGNLPRDDMKALRLFLLAAEQGCAASSSMLATIYEEGRGVPQDYAEAAKWYRRAAEQGHPGVQEALARISGRGE